MDQIQKIYLDFLNYFPKSLHPIISVALAVLIIYSIFKTLKKDFIFLIILIILLPASIPILKGVWDGVLVVIKFLLNTK